MANSFSFVGASGCCRNLSTQIDLQNSATTTNTFGYDAMNQLTSGAGGSYSYDDNGNRTGGGYATGRELAEFFLPSGPQGGLMAIVLAMVIWSAVCAVTFCLAYVTSSWNYRAFFKNLLGPFWVIFEVCYLLFIVLILAVFGAAAGAIGSALLGWPSLVGTCCLIACISAVTTYGTASVEQLFKWVSIFLYAVYAIFVALSFFAFGDRIMANLAAPAPHAGWIAGGGGTTSVEDGTGAAGAGMMGLGAPGSGGAW